MTLELLVLLFTGGAVFFLSLVIVDVLRRALQQYQDRYLAKHITDLSEMFFFVGPRQLATITIAVTAIGFAVGIMVFSPVVTAALTFAGLLTPTLLVRFYRIQRIKKFERQLIDALGGMSAAFRAGMSLYQAMEEIAKHAQAPLSQEFALTVREMRVGTASEVALESLASRVPSDDLALVVNATNTAKALGGNLAEMFDKVAVTIRERFRIEGRIRALTAQGKLQGIVMGLMPVLVWIGFDAVRPDLTRPMMQHWFGYAVLAVVLIMEFLGALLIRRIIAIRI